MFGIGMPEVLIILALALIILGPKKLPEIAKTLGKAFGEFRKSVNDLKESVEIDPDPPRQIKAAEDLDKDNKEEKKESENE